MGDLEQKGGLYRPIFPSEWKRVPLYTLASWVNGLAFRDVNFSAAGRPVIKIAEVKAGITQQTKFTTQTFDDAIRVRSGDLIFSWSGQPQTSIDVFWWRGLEGWLNQHLFRVTPTSDVDRTFFYFLLRYLKPHFVGIARNKQTTGLGHVTRRDLEAIEVGIPPVSEQRAIAKVLGALDDKIEANRKVQTLMDHNLMLAYRHSCEVCSTSNIEVGVIMESALGGAWGNDHPASAGDVLVSCLRGIDLSYISDGRKPDAPERWLSQAQYAKRAFGENEIWLEGSGSFCGRSLLIGRYLDRWFDYPVRYSNFVKRLVPKTSQVPSAIVWLSLREAYASGLVHAWRTGTAFPNLDIRAVLRHVVVIPPPSVVRHIESLASASLDPSFAIESSALATLRDTLLPKLLSGVLRVRDAEPLVEEAV